MGRASNGRPGVSRVRTQDRMRGDVEMFPLAPTAATTGRGTPSGGGLNGSGRFEAVVAVVLVLFLREVPMRTTFEFEATIPAEAVS